MDFLSRLQRVLELFKLPLNHRLFLKGRLILIAQQRSFIEHGFQFGFGGIKCLRQHGNFYIGIRFLTGQSCHLFSQ